MTKKYALLLFFALLFLYGNNLRPIASGDTVPTSLMPITILTKGNILMDDYNKYYVELGLPIKGPGASGKYIVGISLVQEGVAWFHDRGIKTLKVELVIKAESGVKKILQ